MSIAERLVSHVIRLQEESDRSFALYPENDGLLPNDAIYPLRVHNLKEVCGLIEQAVEKTGGSLSAVLKQNFEPNLNAIERMYPHTSPALKVIIRDFSS